MCPQVAVGAVVVMQSVTCTGDPPGVKDALLLPPQPLPAEKNTLTAAFDGMAHAERTSARTGNRRDILERRFIFCLLSVVLAVDGHAAMRTPATAPTSANLADSGYSSTNLENNAQIGDSAQTS